MSDLSKVLPLSLAPLGLPALAAPVSTWRVTRSAHFEVYAQTNDQRAREILTWFEQLRAFFLQPSGWNTNLSQPDRVAPVQVVVFASPEEYQPYRLRTNDDAYYVGAGSQDYIVMAAASPHALGLAAHEYAHLVLRASGLQLPPWLNEGLAE